MRTFAHRYTDTPHGESHAPISISVLLTAVFILAQWIVRLFFMFMTPITTRTLEADSTPFAVISMVSALLLLVFLGVDFQRNRIEAHGGSRYQYFAFGLAAVVLLAFVWYQAMTMGWVGPLA